LQPLRGLLQGENAPSSGTDHSLFEVGLRVILAPIFPIQH
jgi:hypothetical protein